MTVRRLGGWGAGLLVVLMLAACAPDPVPTTPAEESAATPTPTAEPVALVPESVLPLGCVDLQSLPSVQEQIPGIELSIAVDESSAPAGSQYETFLTAGGLHCVWAGGGRTDGGYDQGLRLDVLADGEQGYEAWTGYASPASVAWRTDAYGDRSMTYCDGSWQIGCYGGVLVDGYWIDVYVRAALRGRPPRPRRVSANS